MKIIFSEDYGNFNFLDSSDYTTNWKVIIKDDENKTVELNGVECVLEWSEEGDERGKWSMSDGVEELASESFKYATKVWSTKNYKARTIAFIRIFNENRVQLVGSWEEKRKERIRKEIEDLENELLRSELSDDEIDVSWIFKGEIEKYKKWITSSEEKLSQYKNGSDVYKEEKERIEGYKRELALLH